jgi:four helix bundle protein
MPQGSFRDLIAWQKAMTFVVDIYAATEVFPKHEMFCLTNQMRRAAISIPSNIAEGDGRASHVDRRHFLYVARGSSLELQTQVEIAARLGYLKKETAVKLIDQGNEVSRILNGLIKARAAKESLRTSISDSRHLKPNA